MDPATQLALVVAVGGAIMALIAMANTGLMFWLNSMKERRIDERQRLADERADRRADRQVEAQHMGADLVASKVVEVKDVAKEAKMAAKEAADRVIETNTEALENQTKELKTAIKNGSNDEEPPCPE